MAGSTPVTGPMHENELSIPTELVRSLLEAQFPEYADLPIVALPPVGTDNSLFRLGEELVVRMPRIDWAAESAAFEATWLPQIAPYVSLPIPVPVALGEPGEGYPWSWTIVPWIPGENPELGGGDIDPEEWADALDAPGWAGEPSWLHGDLHEGNLLVRDGRFAAVIDWGAAGRGDPAVELNAMWGSLPPGVEHHYFAATGLDESARRRARGYRLAPAISGAVYYRDTAPEMSRGSLETVRSLIDSLE
jgi:aminoglycoside phosphotransferase (APT) family kinase protein